MRVGSRFPPQPLSVHAGEDSSGEAGFLDSIDRVSMEQSLDERGHARLPRLLDAATCRQFEALYGQPDRYRKRVVMAEQGYGRGEYRYFAYPLPPSLARLRRDLYALLAPIANRWNVALGQTISYPATMTAFLARCHAAGQTLPTPLMLEYRAGDFNHLHQDLYGEHAFPLQVVIMLSRPQLDFTGGEFAMVERVEGAQRIEVVTMEQGDAVIFAGNQRPSINGPGGTNVVVANHGVSRVHSGRRLTLGVIFHDAQ
ncbi:MAG: 2OG-Fe(II) oxygenase [Pigmentiphaga sp.]